MLAQVSNSGPSDTQLTRSSEQQWWVEADCDPGSVPPHWVEKIKDEIVPKIWSKRARERLLCKIDPNAPAPDPQLDPTVEEGDYIDSTHQVKEINGESDSAAEKLDLFEDPIVWTDSDDDEEECQEINCLLTNPSPDPSSPSGL